MCETVIIDVSDGGGEDDAVAEGDPELHAERLDVDD